MTENIPTRKSETLDFVLISSELYHMVKKVVSLLPIIGDNKNSADSDHLQIFIELNYSVNDDAEKVRHVECYDFRQASIRNAFRFLITLSGTWEPKIL